MKYKAIVTWPGMERARQCFFPTLKQAVDWVQEEGNIVNHPETKGEIFLLEEKLVASFSFSLLKTS
jgi:hypothetical protein